MKAVPWWAADSAGAGGGVLLRILLSQCVT